MSEWQPIETAPKDGTPIIVYRPNGEGNYMPKVGSDYWNKRVSKWGQSSINAQPTLWQPLPLSPDDKPITLGASNELESLMRFYQVSDIPSLALAQAKHIERLQAKLPQLKDEQARNPRGG